MAVIAAAVGIGTLMGSGARIAEGVSVGGIRLDGKTKKEARLLLENLFGGTYETTDVVLQLPDTELHFTPAMTGASLDIRGAVNDALACGQQEGAPKELAISSYLKLNEQAIRDELDAYAQRYALSYTPSGYALEGTAPQLEADKMDPNAPGQTLVLTVGTPGLSVDMEEAFRLVMKAYDNGSFRAAVTQTDTVREPEALDLDAIYAQLLQEPVNPTLDRATLKPVPGVYGVRFDLEKARAELAEASYGDVLRIPMEYTEPVLPEEEVYFQDVLGYCKTPHGKSENRNANLKLACQMLDGLILQPGEILSYNETVGERTADRGFKKAPAYSGTELVDSLGGGVCQVSSTLFLCSLYAELETVERVNHGFPVSYIPVGLDATVSWGKPDLKIRNDSDLPVKIVASVDDTHVNIRIMGTELRDYYVKMEYRSGGSYSTSYTCRYDRKTDELIYRELHHRSGYMSDVLSQYGWIGSNERDF